MAVTFQKEDDSKSRKALIIVAAILLTALIGITGWLYHSNVKHRDELNAAAEDMIRDMAASGWSKAAIQRHTTAALAKWMNDNHLDDGIPNFRALGAVKEYKGIQDFRPNLASEPEGDTVLALVAFDGGDASISLHLTKEDGEWRIHKINLDASMVQQGGK